MSKGSLFGLDCGPDSAIGIVPAPWDVTTSYMPGTSNGPDAICEASWQLDLHHSTGVSFWDHGIFMSSVSPDWADQNRLLRPQAEAIMACLSKGDALSPDLKASQDRINHVCGTFLDWLQGEIAAAYDRHRYVGLLGGEHSVSLAHLRYLASKGRPFSVFQIDAHMDLRLAYEGFTYSHASVMRHAIQLPAVERLVQVGIRDYCAEETDVVRESGGKVSVFYDAHMRARQFEGETWRQICEDIVSALGEDVYLSVDIDGLDPSLCPHTGTPVAGGLSFREFAYLIRLVAERRRIIGFDLVEVSPGEDTEWDANVGARVLWGLCGELEVGYPPP